jgi:hypothetical protein
MLQLDRPPEWHKGKRHCITVVKASLQTKVWSQAASQPARDREIHEAAHNWPIVVQVRGGFGFRVKQAVGQEAMQLGRVVFRRMHASRPSPLPSSSLPIGYHEKGVTKYQKKYNYN